MHGLKGESIWSSLRGQSLPQAPAVITFEWVSQFAERLGHKAVTAYPVGKMSYEAYRVAAVHYTRGYSRQPTYLNILYPVLHVWYDALATEGMSTPSPRIWLHPEPSAVAHYHLIGVAGDTGCWMCERQMFSQILWSITGSCEPKILNHTSLESGTSGWPHNMCDMLDQLISSTAGTEQSFLQVGVCFRPQPTL